MAHLQNIGLQRIQQQLPQQIPLAQGLHIAHGHLRTHHLIQQFPAAGGYRLPVVLGVSLGEIRFHQIAKYW